VNKNSQAEAKPADQGKKRDWQLNNLNNLLDLTPEQPNLKHYAQNSVLDTARHEQDTLHVKRERVKDGTKRLLESKHCAYEVSEIVEQKRAEIDRHGTALVLVCAFYGRIHAVHVSVDGLHHSQIRLDVVVESFHVEASKEKIFLDAVHFSVVDRVHKLCVYEVNKEHFDAFELVL
jgi:hypothetical protein